MLSRVLTQAIVMVWLTMSFGAASLEAQVPQQAVVRLEDVVYLKDGGIVRGTIVERLPEESVLIRTRDGGQFRYRMDRIERLAREAPSRLTSLPLARKHVGAAVALGVLFPGTGQAYNGQWKKATGLLLASFIALNAIGSVTDSSAEAHPSRAADRWSSLYLGLMALSAADAGYTASKINRKIEHSASLIFRPAPALASERDGAASSFAPGGPVEIGVRLTW